MVDGCCVGDLGEAKGGGEEKRNWRCVVAREEGLSAIEVQESVTGSNIPMLPSPKPVQISGTASAPSGDTKRIHTGDRLSA